MNSSNRGGGHAMAIGSHAPTRHTASGFFSRCSTFNDQAIQAHREVSQSVSCFRGRTHRRCAQRGNTVEASRRAARASARANDTACADVRADGAARARDPARADLAARAGAGTRAGARTIAGARADDAVARAGRSPRSRSHRCSLRTWRRGRRHRRGRRSCRACPLATPPPPEGNEKEVSRRRRRRETTVVAKGSACQPPVSLGSARLRNMINMLWRPGADLQTAPASAAGYVMRVKNTQYAKC
jgi:hypothetical protein